MRPIVNPLHDPAVDAIWAEADGLAAPRSRYGRRRFRRPRFRRPRGRAIGWRRRRLAFKSPVRTATIAPAGRAPFGLSPRRFRQLYSKYQTGLSGIECDELENLAGWGDDEPYTLGDLDGFFKKIRKKLKKVRKKVFKVVKKVVKSKAFKIAAIGAAAWFAGPAIIAKLAAKKGITTTLARAALKRGAQRLGKTGAVSVGGVAATSAAPAPPAAVDYDAIFDLGMQSENRAVAQLAPTVEDSTTMYVPGEIGGPKLGGFQMGPALLLGGGALVVMALGAGRRR